MSTIVTRAGKGSALSFAEVDGNFTNLNTDKVEGQSSSVDSEIALFSGTGGKTIKRATTTGVLKASSGVISAATAGTDYLEPPSGTAILKANSGGALANATAGTDYVAPGSATTFTVAQTFRAANAIRSEAASTQDAIVVAGRAGGTGTFAVTLTPTTLASNTTLTLPNVTDTLATVGTAQTFTAAQTFRAANAIRSEAASTQDAVVIAGRAGGTGSFALTLTPTTLSANRTVTIPDAGANYSLGYLNVPQSGSDKTSSYTLALTDIGEFVGVGTSGSITIPNSTFAAGDIVSVFNNTTGNITITCSITTAYIAGTNTDKDTMTLATRGVATILFISGTVCVVTGNVS